MIDIRSIQECPLRQIELAEYVKEKWPNVEKVVLPKIHESLATKDGLPFTFLLLKHDVIIGFYQLIEQEFLTRKDLSPWISPLFIDKSERGNALGSLLLEHAKKMAGQLGYQKVYLTTDHIQYYEKYGFREIGLDNFEWGRPTKIYEHDTVSEHMEAIVKQRLDSVREFVQEMIESMVSVLQRQEACVHLYGVSALASMLAMKRGQNQELAAIIGLLHNYYFYKTGINEFPGPNSADTVRPLLREMEMFTKEELTTILSAIFHQGDRSRVHGPHDEIVKDAYVLQLYFQNRSRVLTQQDVSRLRNVFHELGIPEDYSDEIHRSDEREILPNLDRRSKMADIAESLGKEDIIGIPENERYREICKYWPDQDIYTVLQSNWCAAFVYHCCMEAGFKMPIRYPNANYRLAGVGAWLEWAQLPEIGFLYFDGQNEFIPQRGDIVIYEKLLTDDSHDHIGIILACDDNEIVVAEGNRDNQNCSSVFYRDRWRCIHGYIRIANDYQFHFSGNYIPIT